METDEFEFNPLDDNDDKQMGEHHEKILKNIQLKMECCHFRFFAIHIVLLFPYKDDNRVVLCLSPVLTQQSFLLPFISFIFLRNFIMKPGK